MKEFKINLGKRASTHLHRKFYQGDKRYSIDISLKRLQQLQKRQIKMHKRRRKVATEKKEVNFPVLGFIVLLCITSISAYLVFPALWAVITAVVLAVYITWSCIIGVLKERRENA